MDKLQQIMNKQAELQRRLGTNFADMDPHERAEFMRNHRGYLADELAEALYEMPYYKLWKNYNTMTDAEQAVAWQKVRMELIDCLHFFVNLLLCAGMTADEVHQMYMAKNKENHRRQDAGYNADVSYRDQAVSDVMIAARTEHDESACAVVLDGEEACSRDFISILVGENGETNLLYNTDVVTFGMAIQMLAIRYTEMLQAYPEDTQQAIRDAVTLKAGENIYG